MKLSAKVDFPIPFCPVKIIEFDNVLLLKLVINLFIKFSLPINDDDVENLKFYNISLRATLDDTIKPFVENTNKNYSSQVLTIDELKLVDKTINSYITKLESELSSATTKGVENTNQITAVSVDLLSKQKSALILFSFKKVDISN